MASDSKPYRVQYRNEGVHTWYVRDADGVAVFVTEHSEATANRACAALNACAASRDGEVGLLNYIRHNCKVIAWDGPGSYPIEHNPHANKDSWEYIEGLAARSALAPGNGGEGKK